MKRTLLSMIVLLGSSAGVFAEEGWVNLLERTEPSRHAVQGEWTNANGLNVGAASSARMLLPYRPGTEYDFRVSFTRNTGAHSIALVFVSAGKQAAFEVDAWGQHLAGFQNVGGKDLRQNDSRVAGQTLVNGTKYTAVVSVRRDTIAASINGKELTSIKSNGSDLSLSNFWTLPDTSVLGVGAWQSETTFHSIEVRPVTGKGVFVAEKVEPSKVATSKPETSRPGGSSTATVGVAINPGVAATRGDGKGRVLMVIANDGFFYREYGEPRRELEKAGFTVDVAAGFKSQCVPHQNSGQGPDGGVVQPDYAITQVKADPYVAIVFSGGWGSSMYQYAFKGNYNHRPYNGTTQIKSATNNLINDFVRQDKHVGALCHGVSVLAWSRVGGQSLLKGKKVCAPPRSGPAGIYDGKQAQPPSRWNSQVNGANLSPPRSIGNPRTPIDDVAVDGKILTAEDDSSATEFGRVLARELLKSKGQ